MKVSRNLFFAILGTAAALLAYLYGLSGTNIPRIGDEPVYMQVARITAQSHHWLPLQNESGILNTKPPFLFWQAILSTQWATHWDLLSLRLPSVMWTLLVAFSVGWIVWNLLRDSTKSFLAAFIYLGFMSTFQYGRPYLMHSAESFFLFLPLLLYLREGSKLSWKLVLLSGVTLGIACLYKSFIIMAPVLLAFGWIALLDTPIQLWTSVCFKMMCLSLLALGVFSLWFVFDPRPDLIWQQFILGQNVEKFGASGYFHSLWTGTYPLTRIWLGDFFNSGLYFLLLANLLIVTLKTGFKNKTEVRLWIYVVSFLIPYSFPRQRQENYILPTMAALSVLLVLRIDELSSIVFRVSSFIAGIALSLATWLFVVEPVKLMLIPFSWGTFVLLGALILFLAVTCFLPRRLLIRTFPIAILLSFFGISLLLRPFDAEFSASTRAQVEGKTVYVPATFPNHEELFHFLLPAREFRSVNENIPGATTSLLDRGEIVAFHHPLEEKNFPLLESLGSRVEIRSRLSFAQIKELLSGGHSVALFHRLEIFRKRKM